VPWLTGTASWSIFVALSSILGIVPETDGLRIDPCIPRNWPGFEIERVFRGHRLRISVSNPSQLSRGVRRLRVGGKTIEGNVVPVSALHDGLSVEVVLES
jgi:N,N'-diacetylchitobiose phosphorylase